MPETKSLIVENIRTPITANDFDIIDAALKRIKRVSSLGQVLSSDIYKKSVDARRKNDISFVSSVYFVVESKRALDASWLLKLGIKLKNEDEIRFVPGKEQMSYRPVVVGFGPAGMFAALYLSMYGYKPIVLERGASVSERVNAVERFKKDGILDTETNIQFGAGGAGTFSDGKLTTRINDPYVHSVLSTFASMGAPDTILKMAKPHVGTDVLRCVVETFHRRISSLGGEIRYGEKVSSVGDGYIVSNGEKLPSGATVLAIGHSARDLYLSLYNDGFEMIVKPFSAGVRIEHLCKDIDRAMYGDEALSAALGHAEYSLSLRKGERGVYTFCMCPGGEVVAAASENGGVVTNGMSNSRRDGKNSNAAIAVSVLPSDIGSDPMEAVAFQRSLERRAFEVAGRNYYAPCQSVGDFYAGSIGEINGKIKPSYRDGLVAPGDFNKLFPAFISSMLKDGIAYFGKKIKGFDYPDVPLTGVETRTSSPIRILRADDFIAVNRKSVYPCGEGAGYAGGIVSAAVDGIRVAGAIISKYLPKE